MQRRRTSSFRGRGRTDGNWRGSGYIDQRQGGQRQQFVHKSNTWQRGREAELVQGHLEDIQEVRDSSVDRDLIEGACRMYSASIIRNMGILSLIVGLKIEMLRGFKLKFLG